MDPSDEQHDDDLFADLYVTDRMTTCCCMVWTPADGLDISYGDDEPPKSSSKDPQPKAAPVAIQSKEPAENPVLAASDTARSSAPASTPWKAVDPRAPQLPTGTQPVEEAQLEDSRRTDQSQEYNSWDASTMGQVHSGNDSHGSADHAASNGYVDQSVGSPAIKEDGCVLTSSFPFSFYLFSNFCCSSEGRDIYKIAEDRRNGPQPIMGE
jgi:hypothetical protein